MKKYSLLLFLSFFLLILTSCDDNCMGIGRIKFFNHSTDTVYRIIVDDVSYGNLKPGESKEISLAARERTVQLIGIDGSEGCPPQQITLIECDILPFSCFN